VSRLAALRPRLPAIVVCVLLTGLAFGQDPGQIAPDTKLDLTQDPWGFLGRAMDLWDPIGFGGQLQNQAYGYLFPMGPFFAVGDAVGLPPWVVQRLWWAVVLCVGFTGMYVLARRLGIGSPAGHLLAGVAYALSPRILSTLGPVSAEAWPMALAPWVVVPLVMGAGGGSYRRRALLSGLVVAAMGGVNAALVLAAVAPAGLYLLTRQPGERAVRLAGWWVVSVVAATVWWVVPLVLLGANSPPFLDYIESAAVTTDPTSLAEVVRGTSHWVGYLGPGLGSPWQAGHDLVTEPALILNTVVVAAVGLAGLTLRGLPERGWLVATLIVGVLALTFGHDGPGTGWFTGVEREALDDLLAPLRNVHKFDPLVRIPLVLGLAHVVGVVVRRVRDDRTRTAAWAIVGMTALAVVGGAGPALAGRIAPEGSYEAVPTYWDQTADWLEEYADGRALLVPGSRFGVYYWGAPNDEPLQALSDAPWEVRNAIPLVPAGHIRLLDALEQRFAAGQPSDGLAAYLARAGIGYLVVRNDLDQTSLDTPRPVLVHQVLEGSPGLARVAAFGPRVAVEPGEGTVVDDGLQPAYPAVEIWSVDGPTVPVSITPLSDVTTVVGGPESLLDLADAGELPSGPTVLAADEPEWIDSVPAVLTDGLRRREVVFGASLDNTSPTLTGSDPLRLDQPASDYLVTDDERYATVADWIGVRDVAVSSSASDAGAWGGSQPALQPAAAFDQRAATAWRADLATAGEPQWMRVDFDEPVELDIVQIVLPRGVQTVDEVVVAAAGETYRTEAGERRWIAVDLDGRPTDSLTVELRPEPGSSQVMGIAELELPGVAPRRTVRMPDVLPPTQPPSAVVATAPAGHRPGCVETTTVVCTPELLREGEEDAGLERVLTLHSTDVYALSARLAPVPGPALDRWIGRLAGLRVDVTASSSGVDDPRGGPLAAVDGQVETGWVAGPFDAEPTLELEWGRPTPIETLRLVRDDDLVASAPSRVVVSTDSGRYDVAVGADGTLLDLPPLRTRRLSLRLHDPIRTRSYNPATERTTLLPIGVSEIEVDGESLSSGLTTERQVRVPCGRGPNVLVDGELHRTEVVTTGRDLVELRPAEARLCEPVDVVGDPTPELTLAEGSHALSLPATSTWRPLSLTLADARWHPGRPVERVGWSIDDWGRSERRIDVEARPGPALLAVPENANAGWVATLDGEQLDSVPVDGWQQGFVVPPGPAGTIELRYAPTTGYRAALIVGAGLVGLLAIGVVIDRRRRSPDPSPARPRRWPRWVPSAGAVVAFVGLGGAVGLAVALTVGAARILVGRWRRLGPAAREYGWAAATFGVYGAAGVLLAWQPAGSADYTGDGWAVQVLTLVALAMVAAATLVPVPTPTAAPAAPATGPTTADSTTAGGPAEALTTRPAAADRR
jgi:arabinofuranan 3-O-arabinosyltransferase